MANEIIRAAAKRRAVKLWEVAAYCGIADTTLCRQMRRELPVERQKEMLAAIDAIAAERAGVSV